MDNAEISLGLFSQRHRGRPSAYRLKSFQEKNMLCSSLRFESQKTLHFFEIISNFILLYINMNKFEDELLGVYRSFAWYWLRVWFSDNIGKKSWVEFKHLRSAFLGCIFLLRLLAGTHGVNSIEMSLALPGLNVSLLRRLWKNKMP